MNEISIIKSIDTINDSLVILSRHYLIPASRLPRFCTARSHPVSPQPAAYGSTAIEAHVDHRGNIRR